MTNELRVSKIELAKALKPIKRHLLSTKQTKAGISFDGENLHIRFADASIWMPAVGQWVGEAHVDVSFFKMLSLYPPKSDLLVFRGEKERLFVDSISVECVWQSSISLPMDSPLPMVLSLRHHYTHDEIKAAGLDKILSLAEKRRDSLIKKACTVLKELGITEMNIQEIVDRKVKDTSKP